eukprot:gene946-1832_t
MRRVKLFGSGFQSKRLYSFPSGWENPNKVTKSSIPAIATEYLSKILTSQVYEAANETPMTHAALLSSETGNELYLKREDMQPVFSFKIRGAYNKIAKLTPEERSQGVVACSAGNHAQGVALSAAKLGIHATIVMPLATPAIKLKAVQRLGGDSVTVRLHGQNYDAAATEAKRLVVENKLIMIHPFDDPEVIAGQGTVGKEIIKHFNGRHLDAVFCCVGGGGLLSGVAAYIKAIRPDVLVIGVEADDAAGMTSSLIAQEIVTLPYVGLFADGAAVRTVGTNTYALCNTLADAMVTVNTDEICAAIKHGFNATRSVMEPAGALAIAGMLKYAKQRGWKEKSLVAVASGANMDFDRLRFVSERADSSEVLFSVVTPERPGSFLRLHSLIHPRAVTEYCYRCNGTDVAYNVVSVKIPAGVDLIQNKMELFKALRDDGLPVEDLSSNELAKAHIRHLAGGRTFNIPKSPTMKEVIFRFEFPEAPGALNKFLLSLNFKNQGWSISLFHYRNHGDDFGRVLVGVFVENSDMDKFNEFLDNLGYTHYEETNNPAYLSFLL